MAPEANAWPYVSMWLGGSVAAFIAFVGILYWCSKQTTNETMIRDKGHRQTRVRRRSTKRKKLDASNKQLEESIEEARKAGRALQGAFKKATEKATLNLKKPPTLGYPSGFPQPQPGTSSSAVR